MDIIARAIQQNSSLCIEGWEKDQTWERFEKSKDGKDVYLFGAGAGLDYFLRNYCGSMKVLGVVDNNMQAQRQKLGWWCAEAWQTEYEEIEIDSPDIFKKANVKNVIVLITVMNGYREIREQLLRLGVTECFVLLLLEADKRKKGLDIEERDFLKYQNDYGIWCCSQKIQKNKIIMHIGMYGSHAIQITKRLLETGVELDIVWLVDTPNLSKPEKVRLILMKNWKRYLYEAETAYIWLFDVIAPMFLVKRKEQIYIQVKHWSSITLKKFGLDDKIACSNLEAKEAAIKDGERIDYLFSGSEFDEKTFRSGYAFRGRAVRVGSARSDVLFDPEIRKKVLRTYQLKEDANIVLYAPTFRYEDYNRNHRMEVSMDMEGVQAALQERFGGEWYLFLRIHPYMKAKGSEIPEGRHILDVSDYPDCEELTAAADIMITDYSSVMFEGAYKKMPVFLFVPDYQAFMEKDRGILIDYDTLPFPKAESNEELCQCVMRFEKEKYEKVVTEFLDRYGVRENGHASERAAKFIADLINT